MEWDWLGYMIAVAAGVLLGEAHAATRTNRKHILKMTVSLKYIADRLEQHFTAKDIHGGGRHRGRDD